MGKRRKKREVGQMSDKEKHKFRSKLYEKRMKRRNIAQVHLQNTNENNTSKTEVTDLEPLESYDLDLLGILSDLKRNNVSPKKSPPKRFSQTLFEMSSQKKIEQFDPQIRHEKVENLGRRLGFSSEKITAMSNVIVNKPMQNRVEEEGKTSAKGSAIVDVVDSGKFVPQTTKELHPSTWISEGQFLFPMMTDSQKQTLDAVLYSEGVVLDSELQLKRNKLRYKLFQLIKNEQEFDARGQCCWCGKTVPEAPMLLQVHKWTIHSLHTAILLTAKSDHWFEDVVQIQ